MDSAVPTTQSEDRDADSRPVAPAVTAVIVADRPGVWFEETMAALRAQDHPRVSLVVLVSRDDPGVAERVAATTPEARVETVDTGNGFGEAINNVLALEVATPYLLLCHDDVAPRADAVRLMVEEAVRSNAGIVGPKLVDWDDPTRLSQVGIDVDKTGATVAIAEPGELDQEQHDAVRDVFAVPGACTLVRTDLFVALGGYDPVITFRGDDVDLCWRAHVAGARVMVVPAAVVRHVAGLEQRRVDLDSLGLRRRHQLRAMLSNYGPAHLVRVVPQAMLVTVLEAVYSVFTARFSRAKAAIMAWPWNASRFASLMRKRRRNAELRKVDDSEVRRYQIGGFAPLAQYFRHRSEAPGQTRGRALVAALRTGSVQAALLTWFVVLGVAVLGSRHLLSQGVPLIGEFAAFPERGSDLLSDWWGGWRPTGLGTTDPASPVLGLLGLFGWLFGGATGLLRTVVFLGTVPVGILGAYRLVAPFSSRRTQIAAVIAYVAAPLPYNALANGSFTALLLYALTPWIVALVARAWRQSPYGPLDGPAGAGVAGPSPIRDALGLGITLGVLIGFAPLAGGVIVLILVALLVGSAICGMAAGAARMLTVSVVGLVIGIALNLPWSLDLVDADGELLFGTRSVDGSNDSLADLFRLDVGPVGGGTLGWALPAAALLPLVLGTGERFAWAVRGWCLYIAAVAVAWLSAAGVAPVSLPRPDAILAPGALGLAIAVAMGMAAFEHDLRRYRFGWRQAVPLTAAVALAAATIPIFGSTLDGRWEAAERDFGATLRFVEEVDEPFRVLWIGDPDLVPIGTWELADGVGFGLSTQGLGTFTDRWAPTRTEPVDQIAESLDIALRRGTSRLGGLLSPFGIRYIVLPERIAPAPFGELETPAPAGLVAVLGEQLDLERVALSPGVVVYANAANLAIRTSIAAGQLDRADSFTEVARLELTTATAALEGELTGAAGRLEAGTDLFVSIAADDGWTLEVNGSPALRRSAFGWAMAFAVPDGGASELGFATSGSQRLVRLLQLGGWLLAAVLYLRLVALDREGRG